jgi:hypothetical protein
MIYLGIASSLFLAFSTLALVRTTPGFSLRTQALSSIVREPGRLVPFTIIMFVAFGLRFIYLYELVVFFSSQPYGHVLSIVLCLILACVLLAVITPVTINKTFHKFFALTAFWLAGFWIIFLHFVVLPQNIVGQFLALLFVVSPIITKYTFKSWGPAEIVMGITAILWDIFILFAAA